MSSIDKAVETQLKNIEKRAGKSLAELTLLIQQSGLSKHSEIRQMLQNSLGLGYGDANTLVHFALKSDGASIANEKGLSAEGILDEIYSGAKSNLRPIHTKLMAAINKFGAFEIAPKKGYVSLRRKRQFAMLGPATNTRVEVGINIKELAPHERLNSMPPGSMCNFKVKVTDPDEVDNQLIDWIKQAYDRAG